MGKSVLLLASVASIVLLVSGMVLADNIGCPNRGENGCWGTDEGDNLRGTDQADTMRGLKGNDTMRGFDGDDRMDGGEDQDTILGGDGMDHLVGYTGLNTLDGGDGNDYLENGHVSLGGSGDDTLRHGMTMYGGDGNDRLRLGHTMFGGNGDDTFSWGTIGGKIYVDAGPGEDSVNNGNWPSEIHTVDGERDVITCWSITQETVYADDIDELVDPDDCDEVIIR